MDIKKSISFMVFLVVCLNLIIFLTLSHTSLKDPANIETQEHEGVINSPNSNDLELTDKVYTFTAPSDTLQFRNYLVEKYLYLIYIELVTEHNCSTMKMTIYDDNDREYEIFESNMFYEPDYGRYFEIPFGVVDSGLYNFTFYSESTDTFNMHILIEQGPKCLHDKMSQQEGENKILFDVERFHSGESNPDQVWLETDEMYKFYIGRVSAISIKQNNEIRINLNITAPGDTEIDDDIEFEIYSNDILANIDGVSSFQFGTAVEGVYKIKMTIYITDPDVGYVNIAYAVVDDYTIGDAEDVNTTRSDVKESKSKDPDVLEDVSSSLSNLPTEWLVGTLIFVGGISGATTIVLMQQKKHNVVSLNPKK